MGCQRGSGALRLGFTKAGKLHCLAPTFPSEFNSKPGVWRRAWPLRLTASPGIPPTAWVQSRSQ